MNTQNALKLHLAGLSQTLIVHMIRTKKIPFIQSWATAPVLATAIMAVGIFLPFSGFADAQTGRL